MVFCSNSWKKHTVRRPVNPVTKVCTECMPTQLEDTSQRIQIDCMNVYYDSSIFPNNRKSADSINNINTNDDDVIITANILKKSVSELYVADILKINMYSNKSIEIKLDAFRDDIINKVSSLDQRIEILESKNLKKGEENFVLKDIITNMQRCINKSNSETRDKNVIITGVPEEAIAIDNGRVNNDTDKIKWLLRLTKNNYFTENAYDNFDIRHLGKEKVGFNRVIQIILPSAMV